MYFEFFVNFFSLKIGTREVTQAHVFRTRADLPASNMSFLAGSHANLKLPTLFHSTTDRPKLLFPCVSHLTPV